MRRDGATSEPRIQETDATTPCTQYQKGMIHVLCPRCGKEMKSGFLFTTNEDGLNYADEVPGMLHKAKSAEGYVEVVPLRLNHRAKVPAYHCTDCQLVLFEY